MSFTNRIVLITGAASGIGEAIAKTFAKESASLSLLDLNKENLDKVAEDCEKLTNNKVLKIVVDISIDKDLKEAVSGTIHKFGKIDVIINCAGIYTKTSIRDSNILETFDKILNVNLRSMVAIINFALPTLIENKGCIVNISSVMSKLVSKNGIAYNVSKAGVTHLTKCLALELGEFDVRVNCIAPGVVRSNILKNIVTEDVEEYLLSKIINGCPIKRDVKAEEIGHLALYLASDKARNITGAEYTIDSGLTISSNITVE